MTTVPFVAPRAGRAATLPTPSGRVILTSTGQVSATSANGAAKFDLAMLDAVPQRETVTSTPWHDGAPSFSGPLIGSLLDAMGATGRMLRIDALNDYAADMPMEDARAIPVILATRIDGEEMPVRGTGPLFVIYPFDERPELLNEVHVSRSVWQVKSIEVGG